jgi:uncharacterized protein YjbJ (UPF0337 family)
MNWTQLEGKWQQVKGQFRTQWGKLTDSDVETLAGKRDQLAGKIVERYGIAKDEAERQLDTWLERLDENNEASRNEPPRGR